MILEIREYMQNETPALAVIFGPDEEHLVSLGSWPYESDEDQETARRQAEAGLETASQMLGIYDALLGVSPL